MGTQACFPPYEGRSSCAAGLGASPASCHRASLAAVTMDRSEFQEEQ